MDGEPEHEPEGGEPAPKRRPEQVVASLVSDRAADLRAGLVQLWQHQRRLEKAINRSTAAASAEAAKFVEPWKRSADACMLMVTELQTGLRSTTEQLVQLQKRFIAQMNAKEAVEKVERYAAAKLRRELAAAERAKQEERRRRRESADQKKHAAEAVKAEARWLEETERMEREAKQRMSTTKEVDPPLSPAENVVKDEQAGPLTFAQLMARNAQPAEPREGKLQDRSKLKPNPKPAIAVAGSDGRRGRGGFSRCGVRENRRWERARMQLRELHRRSKARSQSGLTQFRAQLCIGLARLSWHGAGSSWFPSTLWQRGESIAGRASCANEDSAAGVGERSAGA